MWEDDDSYECDKFDDCRTCKFRTVAHLYCEDDCDYGESYEEEDQDEVDKHFKGRL